MKELNAQQTEEVTGALTKRPTTLIFGEEGGVTTLIAGEESPSTRKLGEEGPIYTTLALGEEGNPPAPTTTATTTATTGGTSALGSF